MSELAASDRDKLVEAARAALATSYSPYSKFAVGAALLTHDGRIYSGANIENSSYGLTICAERVALFKAVTEGIRQFAGLAIAAGTGRFLTPCGACRQVLAEFALDLPVLIAEGNGTIHALVLRELLPHAFSRDDLDC